jgi:hypothetical protein
MQTTENQCIVLLCHEHDLNRERRGYNIAFNRKIKTVCISPYHVELSESIDSIISRGLNPILIIQPDASPALPYGLEKINIPTACFQIDTYNGTSKRIKWSMLFDYAIVFHPQFDELFQNAGHPRTICLPHAVEADLFREITLDKIYDVGWVGSLEGKHYSTRRRCIHKLQKQFHMNDVNCYYTPEQMASIYSLSKIVVNISRDDYLKDANLRCFEAMAAGALLITPKPTELSDLGFIEGVHYIAYHDEDELYRLVKFYLEHEDEREIISTLGQSLVVKEHTYTRRVEIILDIISKDAGKLFAPARKWSKALVHITYLHYFAKHLMLDLAIKELREIRAISRGIAWRSIPMIIKAFIRSLQLSI